MNSYTQQYLALIGAELMEKSAARGDQITKFLKALYTRGKHGLNPYPARNLIHSMSEAPGVGTPATSSNGLGYAWQHLMRTDGTRNFQTIIKGITPDAAKAVSRHETPRANLAEVIRRGRGWL
jgi:hypothetical protein